ncbi:hypothetical protein GCM10017771_36140 [Streptomyces capitiformicae]|uniref:Uncharacterized protein n=1 Tax=Streptomyces capitiformicae TaxID=2014920 RepID=A0A919GS30_9ACTN|nr:hypothetical protein GCM10017771_36140 [Streptomyces capitiformicae]
MEFHTRGVQIQSGVRGGRGEVLRLDFGVPQQHLLLCWKLPEAITEQTPVVPPDDRRWLLPVRTGAQALPQAGAPLVGIPLLGGLHDSAEQMAAPWADQPGHAAEPPPEYLSRECVGGLGGCLVQAGRINAGRTGRERCWGHSWWMRPWPSLEWR